MDVTDPGAVSAAFDAVCTAWGGVDLVIPNAGPYSANGANAATRRSSPPMS